MALTAQTAANWTAQQRAWLRANDPNKLKKGNQLVAGAGLKPKVTKAQVDAAAGGSKLTMQPAGKSAGGNTSLGFEKGVAYPSRPGSKGSALAGALGGAAGYAAAGGTAAIKAGFGALSAGALGTGLALASNPIGWGIAGIALARGLTKKSNRDFEGTRDTGGAAAWVKKGGSLYDTGGKVPTMEEFTSQGRWLMPQDEYAHDYGRRFSGKDAKYYENFKNELAKYKEGSVHWNAIMRAHGFGAKAKPKPVEAPQRRSAPAPVEAPYEPPRPSAPIKQEERDEITPPASGLEDTIKTTPQLLRERRRRSYLTRG